jgi:dTDP-4-dehydrorhamnose reductase
MRIAMTGSTGLVGSRLVELLAPKHEIVELREENGFDVLNFELVRRSLAAVDAVVHLAAFTDVSEAWRQRDWMGGTCYRVNVVGARNVAQACAERGLYLVHFSTDFVFDGRKATLYAETDHTNPIEWYGQTKWLAENAVYHSTASAEFPAGILRISFPFRACFPQKLDLVRWILEGLFENTLPPMAVDQVITPTFIDDLAPVVDYFVAHRPPGIFHAVGSTIATPYSLACQIARTLGFPPTAVRPCYLDDLLQKDSRPRQQFLGLSNAKLRQLGLEMSDLESALAEVRRQM